MVKALIKYIGAALVIFFTWLQFKEIPAPEINDKLSSTFLRVTLTLCYLSWIYGTITDLNDEEYTFIIAPNRGKLTKTSVGMIFMAGILFALLCLSAVSLRFFTIVLTLFSISGKIGEIYMGKFVGPAIEESKTRYSEANDYLGLLSIIAIEQYIMGKWFWKRFFVGSIILVFVNLLSFTELSVVLAAKLHIQSSSFVIVSSIFIYLFVMELWIWYKRIKRKLYLELLADLNKDFILVPNNSEDDG